MTTSVQPVTVEQMLDHADWILRLARHLAGAIGEDGEDVAQDVWLAAQLHPPDVGRPPRPWLAQVIRNLIRVRRRNRGRRLQREQNFQEAIVQDVAPVDEVYERLELQRFLAEQVMALDEELRTVVVLRYFEGLDSIRIAAMTGAPSGTVRWRLKRALDQLRARLDDRHDGDRRKWIAILIPGAGPKVGLQPSLSAAGAATEGTKFTAVTSSAFALLAMLLMAWGGYSWWTRGRTTFVRSDGSAMGVAVRANAGLPRMSALRTERAEIEGRVQDGAGRAVAGAIVLATVMRGDLAPNLGFAANPPPVSTNTDRDGHFRFAAIDPASYMLTASRAGAGVVAAPPIVQLGASKSQRTVVLTVVPAKAGLRGKLVDVGGGPVAGGRVLAWLMERVPRIMFAAVSDERGQYALDLPTGRFDFSAQAAGYTQSTYGLTLHQPMVKDFTLEPAARLSGRVIAPGDETGIGGVEVFAINADSREGRSTIRAVSGEGGLYEFADLDPGAYRLVARHESMLAQRRTPVVLLPSGEVSGVDLLLGLGRKVSGRVHSATGVPIAGAQVMAFAEGQPSVVSDAAGSFVIGGLAPSGLYIAASGPGHAPARKRIDVTDGDASGIDIVLIDEATVTGIVRDSAGQPVAGAHVRVSIRSDGSDRAGVEGRGDETDAQGRFTLARLAAGTLQLTATHSAGIGQLSSTRLEAGQTKNIEIVLQPGTEVAGTVVRDDGRPAAGAHVYVNVFDGAPGPAAMAVVGADGRYRLVAFPAQDVVIRATEPGNDPCPVSGRLPRLDQLPLVLRPGAHLTDVNLVLGKSDLTIRGRVFDDKGHAVAGAVIRGDLEAGPMTGYGRALSGEDGQFVLEGLRRGPHTISVAHPAWAELQRDGVSAGTTGLELHMLRPAALVGRVTGAHGDSIGDFNIYARPVLGANASAWELRRQSGGGVAWGGSALRRQLVLLADGAFAFENLAPGLYDLQAYLPQGRVATLSRIALLAGERKEGLLLVARPAVTLKGRVVDHATGRPIPAARIEGRGPGRRHLSAAADAGGNFLLEGLPGGEAVEFAVLGPAANDYMSDQQDWTTPQEGELDVGDVALFPGERARLEIAGPGRTGISIHSREKRAVVFAVYPASSGESAGIHRGDLILAVDGHDVRPFGGSVAEGMLGAAGESVGLLVQTARQAPREVVVIKAP